MARAELGMWGLSKALGVGATTLLGEEQEGVLGSQPRVTVFCDTSQLSRPFLPQACRDFLDLAESHSRKWQRLLQHEREQRIRLEETIEQLAKQHNSLERACRGAPGLASGTASIASTAKGECLQGAAGSLGWGCSGIPGVGLLRHPWAGMGTAQGSLGWDGAAQGFLGWDGAAQGSLGWDRAVWGPGWDRTAQGSPGWDTTAWGLLGLTRAAQGPPGWIRVFHSGTHGMGRSCLGSPGMNQGVLLGDPWDGIGLVRDPQDEPGCSTQGLMGWHRAALGPLEWDGSAQGLPG